MMLLLFGAALAADRPLSCEFTYPIVGSAGYANAQAARQTNHNTYSAAAYADRTVRELSSESENGLKEGWGFFSGEMNWTLGAARVPTLCSDSRPTEEENLYGIDMVQRWERKQRVYEQPLDLYAFNLTAGAGAKGAGLFYSASVTQSVLGFRAWVLPMQLINLYPAVSAPLVGNFQRNDGVASYSVDWIGGAYVDARWVAARAGYTGSRGFYGSVDERALGLFGTLGLGEHEGSTPYRFLEAGLGRLGPERFGAEQAAKIIGSTTTYLRDLPLGSDEPEKVQGEDRLRTIHVEQRSIGQQLDLQASFAIRPEAQLYDAQIGWHSPNFHEKPEGSYGDNERFLVQVGLVNLPAQYNLGVEGGRYFTARAQLSARPFEFALLFNDPEQLAIYPFAVDALSAQLRFVAAAGDL